MPDSKRGILIKKQQQALLHLENAAEDLIYMYDSYYPDYPEHYPPMQDILTAVMRMVEVLRNFREVM